MHPSVPIQYLLLPVCLFSLGLYSLLAAQLAIIQMYAVAHQRITVCNSVDRLVQILQYYQKTILKVHVLSKALSIKILSPYNKKKW